MSAACYIKEENHKKIQRTLSFPVANTRLLAQDLVPDESLVPFRTPKHVVIVMDGLREFTLEPLEWVLKNIALQGSCTITLLGVMPWLNITLSSKTWLDIWNTDHEDLSTLKDKSEWKSDPRYKKMQPLMEFCQKYKVLPQIKTEMGYPVRLVVLEQITSLQAALVVFDRHHDRRYIEYYAEKVPRNLVMMNEDGEVDVIKGRSHINNDKNSNPGESPASLISIPKLMLAEHLKKFLKLRGRERNAKDRKAVPAEWKI